MITPHPAKFNDAILDYFAKWVQYYIDENPKFGLYKVLDPFAGTGKIHSLYQMFMVNTFGVELQPNWANQHERTQVGDATQLPFLDHEFHIVATSPCYGNRMADSHTARDDSKRHTYTHYYGEPLEPNNAGAMQWGPKYRALHIKAWFEVHRVLKKNGLFLLNIKDHDRHGKRQFVTDFHIAALVRIGFDLVEFKTIKSKGMKHGENRDNRYPEQVYVFKKTR